jgi:cytochrome b561
MSKVNIKSQIKESNQAKRQEARYSTAAIVLHWLLGLSIFAMFAIGVYMSDLPFSPTRLKLYNYHKWAGITFLILSVLRLMWRLVNKPPALPKAIEQAMPSWQTKIYHATHYALYALFFVVPLIGWAYSSAAGFPIVLFGVLPLPDFVSVDKEFAKQIKELHGASAFALIGLALLHIGAALKHHFIDKDGLVSRMLPSSSK